MEKKIEKKIVLNKSLAKNIARISICVALLFVCSQIAFPIPFTLVPVTLQTLALMLIAFVLPPLKMLICIVVYLTMGIIGIPVFAQFGSLNAFIGPTGGFLIGFIPASIFLSFFVSVSERKKSIDKNLSKEKSLKKSALKYSLLTLSLVVFHVIVFLFGAGWFMLFMRYFAVEVRPISFWSALTVVWVPFLLGEAIKTLAAIFGYRRLVNLRKI